MQLLAEEAGKHYKALQEVTFLQKTYQLYRQILQHWPLFF